MLLALPEMDKGSCSKRLTGSAFQKSIRKSIRDDCDGPQAVVDCCVEEEQYWDGLDAAHQTIDSR